MLIPRVGRDCLGFTLILEYFFADNMSILEKEDRRGGHDKRHTRRRQEAETDR